MGISAPAQASDTVLTCPPGIIYHQLSRCTRTYSTVRCQVTFRLVLLCCSATVEVRKHSSSFASWAAGFRFVLSLILKDFSSWVINRQVRAASVCSVSKLYSSYSLLSLLYCAAWQRLSLKQIESKTYFHLPTVCTTKDTDNQRCT